MAGRRRKPPRPDPNLLESDQNDGLCWPTLAATWAGLSDEEIKRRHHRAKQLREHGWGGVQWGLSD